jgi:hypothetical protein
MPAPNYVGGINATNGNYELRAKTGEVIQSQAATTQTIRTRFTIAEVNAGATVLAAVPGFKYRIVDWTMIAIGGSAATATSVDLVATASASTVRPAVVLVAALTRSTAVKPNSSNVTLLADGASNTAFDANTAITISKQSGGSNVATATHIDLILSYVVEVA